jgi:hypothetical protein
MIQCHVCQLTLCFLLRKLDLIKTRLDPPTSILMTGDRLQNVVVPLPATSASQDASSVHVFLGSPSSTTPDVGSPLDQVNQLLQKANNIQKGLVATSNLQKFTSKHTQEISQQLLFPWLGYTAWTEQVCRPGDFLWAKRGAFWSRGRLGGPIEMGGFWWDQFACMTY